MTNFYYVAVENKAGQTVYYAAPTRELNASWVSDKTFAHEFLRRSDAARRANGYVGAWVEEVTR